MGTIERQMLKLSVFFINAYRFIVRPVIGDRCRFWPTCSAYAIEALQKYGVLKGWWLTCKRLSKCHPFAKGGCDPV